MVLAADAKSSYDGTNGHTSSITVKPRILCCASEATGHISPVLKVASELVQRGYDVTFIASESFSDPVKNTGAKFVSIPDMITPHVFEERSKFPPGPEQLQFDMTKFFIEPMVPRAKTLYATLESMKQEDAESEIVIVTETFFLGTHPLFLDAPLPKGFTKRPRIVDIHAACYMAASVDTPPAGPGLPPPKTIEERTAALAMRKTFIEGPFAPVIDLEEKLLKELGATNIFKERHLPFENWFRCHDVVLQMCPPSLEYKRSDVPSHIKFAGALGAKPVKKDIVYPEWWSNVVTSGDKRIIAVTQGTVAMDYTNLIIPTMRALADRSDIHVVAILGSKGATLPADFEMPANASVVDYFPYDALLPHCSAFVTNAGYGGFMHGVINGVPLVLAGETEDKPEVAARGEFAGVAVNLRTAKPSEDKVREAVDRLLSEPQFKKRVMEIKEENENMGAMETVEKAILEQAAIASAA